MSKVYDNWERLVAATLKRQQYRELALADSRETSFSSSVSARFATRFNFKFGSAISYPIEYYAERIWAADQVMKAADASTSFKPDCVELKSKVQKLESLLRQAVRASYSLYDRPVRRIMDDVEQVLQKALNLILKFQGVGRVFAIIPSTAFPEVSSQLEHTIRNVSWLLRDDEYSSGVPPIAAEEPTLCHIWELIAILQTGSGEDQCEAATSLVSLAREDVAYRKLIFDEGGVPALLRLLKKGKPEAQVNAATAIGLVLGESMSVDVEIVDLFAETLRRGTMEVQAAVAWAVSELVEKNSQCRYVFEENGDIIRLLTKRILLDSTPPFQSNVQADEEKTENSKEHLTAMAARALHHLAEGNPGICRRIVTSGALSRFTVLLKKGLPEEVRYHSLMTLVAITTMADRFFEFRVSTMRPNSAGQNVIIYELFRLIEMGDALIIPCVRVIGNLAWSFKAKETLKISPLVRLLNDDQEASEVTREICVALAKFASPNNFLSLKFSNVIIDAGGIEPLVQLVYSGEQTVQTPALVLLIHIVRTVPDREEVRAELLTVLEWATKQPSVVDDVDVDKSSLADALLRLEFHKKE